jgi:chromosome partitioning protein
VLIDCPPTISIFTQAAILASNKYIVPLKPDPLSVLGLPLLERWLKEFTEDHGLDIRLVGLVHTNVRGPQPSRMKQIMADIRKDRKDEVFPMYLSQSTYVAESVEAREPIFIYKKNSKVARQILSIVDEFVRRTPGA